MYKRQVRVLRDVGRGGGGVVAPDGLLGLVGRLGGHHGLSGLPVARRVGQLGQEVRVAGRAAGGHAVVAAELVHRAGSEQLLPAPADGLEGLGQHGRDGTQLGVHVGVGVVALGAGVGAAPGGVVGEALGVRRPGQAEELLAAAVDRADGLGEDDLEVGELAVDVVVGLDPDLLRLSAGLVEDAVGLLAGDAGDLGVGDQGAALGAGGLQDPLGLLAGARHQLLPVADDLAGAVEGAGQGGPDLLQEGEQLGPVQDAGGRHGQGAGTGDGRDDLVELLLDVHLDVRRLLEIDRAPAGRWERTGTTVRPPDPARQLLTVSRIRVARRAARRAPRAPAAAPGGRRRRPRPRPP